MVTDIARQYPIPVICALLGAPSEDWELFSNWTDDILKAFSWDAAAETAVILKNEFMKTANWRREQAIDYPDDRWNFEAVVLLERLANTVDEIDPRLLEAYVGLWEGDGLSGAETQSEMLRGVAFTWAPQTASEFVSEFISKMTSGT